MISGGLTTKGLTQELRRFQSLIMAERLPIIYSIRGLGNLNADGRSTVAGEADDVFPAPSVTLGW